MGNLRTQFQDLYLEDALPFMEEIVADEFESFPKVSELIANVHDMKYGIAQHAQVSALSPAGEMAEGEEVPQDRLYQGYSTTFKSKKYGVMLAITQEMIDHERYDILSKNPRKLAKSVMVTAETVFANIFNNGFSDTGSDGKVLFATDHPLLSPGAGTSSNKLASAADLSATSLKDMITVMRKQLDTSGNKIMIAPKKLMVPAELEYVAFELLKSIYIPDSPNNNLSSIGPQSNYKIDAIVNDYLTDSDAWFLLADKADHEIHWFWDKKPEVKSKEEFKTEVALMKITTRFTTGYSDWRGVAGTPGA